MASEEKVFTTPQKPHHSSINSHVKTDVPASIAPKLYRIRLPFRFHFQNRRTMFHLLNVPRRTIQVVGFSQ